MKHYQKSLWIIFLLCITCIAGPKQTAYAAANGYADMSSYKLDEVKTCSQYDVTGDGIKDKVQAVVSYDKKTQKYSYKITVNDVSVFEQTSGENEDAWWSLNLLPMQDGKVFFEISGSSYNDYIQKHGLYEYVDGTLKWFYDMQRDGRYCDRYNVTIDKVAGNTIYTNISAQYYTTGWINYKVNLSYENGAVKATSNSSSIKYSKYRKNKWTANKKISVYKKIGNKKAAYTLKKGDKIKINKIVSQGNKVYFQIKNKKGKTGYIPGAKKYPSKVFFKEAQYAG